MGGSLTDPGLLAISVGVVTAVWPDRRRLLIVVAASSGSGAGAIFGYLFLPAWSLGKSAYVPLLMSLPIVAAATIWLRKEGVQSTIGRYRNWRLRRKHDFVAIRLKAEYKQRHPPPGAAAYPKRRLEIWPRVYPDGASVFFPRGEADRLVGRGLAEFKQAKDARKLKRKQAKSRAGSRR